VRCIKPNEDKSPTQFNYERCKHQVMYLGLLENVRVRRAGFAFRMNYTRFLLRCVCFCRATQQQRSAVGVCRTNVTERN